MPTCISVKHERRDGLTERRATWRVSLRCVAPRSAIAPSVWPHHDIQNHLNHESLGFSQIVTGHHAVTIGPAGITMTVTIGSFAFRICLSLPSGLGGLFSPFLRSGNPHDHTVVSFSGTLRCSSTRNPCHASHRGESLEQ
jgi:hypothetical protein